MPEVALAGIVKVSSEDKVHNAAGLLKGDGLHKWQCAEPGEQQAVVVIELRSLAKITKLHIGNEHSAFIEVFAGRSPATAEKDYSVLLPASSFMSPTESKTHSQPNRVRMFDTTTLCAQTAAQRWDRLKIICTQPFNRQVQYGLSFIRVFTDETIDAQSNSEVSSAQSAPSTDAQAPRTTISSPKHPQTQATSVTTQATFGMFKLRSEEDTSRSATGSNDEPLKPGQLFYAARQRDDDAPKEIQKRSSRDDEKDEAGSVEARSPPKRGRTASSANADNSATSAPVPAPSRTKASTNFDQKLKADPKTKPDSVSKPKAPVAAPDSPASSVGESNSKSKTNSNSNSATKQKANSSSTAPKQTGAAQKKGAAAPQNVPFEMIMKDVVFVLSGFQNPLRSDLRDQALEMGARYKPDWIPGCTHLICAFQNTPKYKQVAGKGRIVKQQWILDCYKQKRLLDWRLYRLGRAPSPPGSHRSDNDDEPEASDNPDDADDSDYEPKANADLLKGLPSLPSAIFRGSSFVIDSVSISSASSDNPDSKSFVHDARRIIVAYGGSVVDVNSPSKRSTDEIDYAVLPEAAYQSDSAKKEATKRYGRSVKLVSLDWLKRCVEEGAVVSD